MVRVYDCHTCRRSHTKISPLSRAALSLFCARRPEQTPTPHRRGRRGVCVEAICFFLISPVAFTGVRELRFLRFARALSLAQTGAAKFAINIHSAPNRTRWDSRRFRRSHHREAALHCGRGRARLIRAQQITACRLARKTAGVLLRRPLAPLDEPADWLLPFKMRLAARQWRQSIPVKDFSVPCTASAEVVTMETSALAHSLMLSAAAAAAVGALAACGGRGWVECTPFDSNCSAHTWAGCRARFITQMPPKVHLSLLCMQECAFYPACGWRAANARVNCAVGWCGVEFDSARGWLCMCREQLQSLQKLHEFCVR